MHCVQPVGNDTIASQLACGAERARAVQAATQITGLQVPSVIDGDAVIAVCRSLNGTGHTVTDEVVYETQQRMAREEGVFCEPAGALPVAAALEAARRGELHEDDEVVCLVTGVGFKDLAALERMAGDASPPLVDWRQLPSMFS